MNQIKDSTNKNRQAELRRNRELAQIKKEQRRKDNQIKTLEADRKKRDIVIKRKQEEVEALRRKQKSQMSAKAAGRTARYERQPTRPVDPIGSYSRSMRKKKFNPRAAKAKWDTLEKTVSYR